MSYVDRDREKAWRKAYNARRRDLIRSYNKKCYLKHRAKRLIQIAKWKADNAERVALVDKSWRERNRHKASAASTKYRRNHPEKHAEIQARRRARVRGAKIDNVDYAAVLLASNGQCGICGKPFDLFGVHFDHKVPLALGGAHSTENIQAAHAFCNLQKGARCANL